VGLLPPLSRVHGAVERLEGPARAPEIEANLADLARLNRCFGAARLVRRHLCRLLGERRAATVVDVGSGGADIPVALVNWARRRGLRLLVIAVDRDRRVLEVARRRARGHPEIVFLQADGLALPLKPEGVDATVSSLTLHHVEPEEAPRLLAEMARVSRLGWVVSDLARGRLAYALVWLATRLLARSPISRHDGPLSVLRAYRAEEVRALARRAGLRALTIVSHPLRPRLAVLGRAR
jgi:2-polyprenyl-3-methyl-5-hydroxy-6-metoxy-1,4-benzoquinol methylase